MTTSASAPTPPANPAPSSQPTPTPHGPVLIIGGSSGIGLGLAQALVRAGTEVTVVSRSGSRLAAASRRLGALDHSGALVRTAAADISRESDVERLFQEAGPVQHVITTAADGTGASGPIATIGVEGAQGFLGTKVLGPWLVAKHCAPYLLPGGSLTFTSGIAAYRPSVSGSVVAAANGALESLAYALALELAPIRVNVVSPGWVDTPVWDTLAGVDRSAALAAMAHRLPAGRIGTPADLAQAYLAVLCNEFMTGSVLHIDGGHRLV